MEEIEERTDGDEDDGEELDEEELAGEERPVSVPPPAAEGEEVESSLEELLAKKEDRKPSEEEDDESMLDVTREERLEPLAVKVVPQQATEFVCKNCYLVKHRSQLADRERMLCRDCA